MNKTPTEGVGHHIMDGVMVVSGALSPWWLNLFEPGLRAFVLIATAIVLGLRMYKLLMQFLVFIGLRRKQKSRATDFEDEED
jgi:hypothetical protein